MRRGLLFSGFILLAMLAYALSRPPRIRDAHAHHKPPDYAKVEPAPLCPWREPARDLAALFSPATNFVIEKRVLSGRMAAIQKALGRPMHADENPLRLHRVEHDGETLGFIEVIRVKAEHGAIELVAGLETNGTLRGLCIQGQREPPAIAQAITNATWLASFAGRNAASALELGKDLPAVPAEARPSAEAIAQGVRELLIVFAFAQLPADGSGPTSIVNR